MPVTSPPSLNAERRAGPDAGRRCEHRLPLRRTAVARENAPAVTVPLRFMAFGLGCLAVAAAWLALSPGMTLAPYRVPRAIAWTHLVVLGFALSTVMGALYQIAPVALEVRLFSERLARVHSWVHLTGVTLMVPMFYVWDLKQVGHSGAVVFAGMLLLVYNLARTLGRVPKPDVVAAFIASSLLWMFWTMCAGMGLAADKFWPFLPIRGGDWLAAHAHCGIVGIFINLIIGVAYRLVPMFAISAIQSPARAWISYVLINAGIAWLYAAIASGPEAFALGCGAVLAAGLGVGLWEIAAICAARQRRRPDWGMRTFLAALSLLIPTAAAGVAAALAADGASVRNAYALLALLGVVGLAIAGMLQKILPFLVWYAVYSPLVGRAPLPALGEMLSVPLQKITLAAWLGGLALLVAGVLLRLPAVVAAGAWFWAGGVAAFVCNALRVLLHLLRPPAAVAGTSLCPR